MSVRARRWAAIATCFAAAACGSSSGGDLYGPGGPDASAGAGGSGGGSGGAAGAAASGGAAGTDAAAGSAGATGDASAGATGTGGSAGVDAGSSGSGGGAGTTGSGGTGGGGPAPGAGQIQCGAATCNATSQNCCRSLLGGCQPNFPPLCTGAQVHCDDSNDCAGGVCCASKALAGWGARCAATCTGNGDVVLCRATSSCDAGLTCKPFGSLPGFDACQP